MVLAAGLLVSGCAPGATVSADSIEARPSTAAPGTVTPVRAPSTPQATVLKPPKQPKPKQVSRAGVAPASAPRAAARLTALDRLAGVRSEAVVWRGSGKLRVVPGKSAAPGKGKVIRI